MRPNCLSVVVVAVFLALTTSHLLAFTPEQMAVMKVMHGMFDKPGSELIIEPVVVQDGFAVADWIQGSMGGRAFLKFGSDKWTLVLCTGDEIRSAEALKASGVPAGTADRLAASIAEAEKNISPDRLKMFASFRGMVRMDEQPGH